MQSLTELGREGKIRRHRPTFEALMILAFVLAIAEFIFLAKFLLPRWQYRATLRSKTEIATRAATF